MINQALLGPAALHILAPHFECVYLNPAWTACAPHFAGMWMINQSAVRSGPGGAPQFAEMWVIKMRIIDYLRSRPRSTFCRNDDN